ncbi:NAD(P)-binding protein [Trematosphaeria pertusa]|uniref:NAD(P)-binding protein n=1 Tax=Trematosphaeria pertusa TaxID=390896 RepID=A0A6A6I7G1_9PLEO|nr:NAD(P)-binding protein [Trematosphaeria pertusa]KAF2245892.1 NAD(P)-binding protein [Trematosphaeria pertusa]
MNKKYPKLETLPVPTDIADPASVAALFQKIKQKYSHADVLANNAGVFKAIAPVKDIDQAASWEELTLNIHGTFLVTQSFLALLSTPHTPAKILTPTTSAAYEVFPALSAYDLSKLVVFQLMTYVAAENPNVLAVSLHLGIVLMSMTIDAFMPFAKDTPALLAGLGTWLAGWEGVERGFLSGRIFFNPQPGCAPRCFVSWPSSAAVSSSGFRRGKALTQPHILLLHLHQLLW